MVVDTGEAELPCVLRLCDKVAGLDAGHLAVDVVDRLRRLHSIAREKAAAARRGSDVPEPGAPLDRRIQLLVADGHGRADRDDVVAGREAELLAYPRAGRVLKLEHE